MKKKDAAKKHAKRLTRRTRLAAKRERSEGLTRKREFPPFVFEPNEAPPEFVDAVRQATEELDFRDEAVLPKWHADLYRDIAKYGAEVAMRDVRMMAEDLENGGYAVFVDFVLGLGRRVFDRIPADFLLYPRYWKTD